MQNNPNPDFDLQSLLEQELQSGETIQWTVQPDPARANKGAIPIGLFFTAFALTGLAALSGWKMPDPSHLSFGHFVLIPFLALGLFILFLGPKLSRKKALNTIYAITNRRAIIFINGSEKTIQSFGPEKLRSLECIVLPDGSGDLILETRNVGSGRDRLVEKIGFIGIPAVREVEKILQSVQ